MNDMEEISNRIIALRKHLGLTQTEFAEKIGLKFSLISMIESGKSPLTESNIRLICFTFGVNEDWLRSGTGEMIDDEALLSEQEKRLLNAYRGMDPKTKGSFLEIAQRLAAGELSEKGEKPE
jgi:transcriptional regulator with XRE-family HTH domain